MDLGVLESRNEGQPGWRSPRGAQTLPKVSQEIPKPPWAAQEPRTGHVTLATSPFVSEFNILPQSFPLPLPALLGPAAALFHGLRLFSSSSHPMLVSSG